MWIYRLVIMPNALWESWQTECTYENARSDDGGKVAGNRQEIPNAKLRFMHRSRTITLLCKCATTTV